MLIPSDFLGRGFFACQLKDAYHYSDALSDESSDVSEKLVDY